MQVKIKKLCDEAVVPYKTYNEDFCYDVVATSCEEVAPNVYKYGIGLSFQIDIDSPIDVLKSQNEAMGTNDPFDDIRQCVSSRRYLPFNMSIDLRPRSSIYKTGMVLANSTGTVDELYNGEVSAVFYHVMPNMQKYEVGDRIAQIKIGITIPMEFTEVDELSTTERGDGGFGSTNKQ